MQGARRAAAAGTGRVPRDIPDSVPDAHGQSVRLGSSRIVAIGMPGYPDHRWWQRARPGWQRPCSDSQRVMRRRHTRIRLPALPDHAQGCREPEDQLAGAGTDDDPRCIHPMPPAQPLSHGRAGRIRVGVHRRLLQGLQHRRAGAAGVGVGGKIVRGNAQGIRPAMGKM